MASEPVRVLFVCLGNICRSPLAEAVFRAQAEARGVADRFEIDSAGISAYHAGSPPDDRSAATAARRGVALGGRSRQVRAEDLHRFDWVIAMDDANLEGLRAIQAAAPGAGARVHRLREWDPSPGDGNVPDPYYGGPRGFDDVHDIVERASAGFLDHLLRDA